MGVWRETGSDYSNASCCRASEAVKNNSPHLEQARQSLLPPPLALMLPDPVAIETATDFSRAGVPGKGSCDAQHKWDRQDNSPHPPHCAHGIFLLSLAPARPLLARSLCSTSVRVPIRPSVNGNNYLIAVYSLWSSGPEVEHFLEVGGGALIGTERRPAVWAEGGRSQLGKVVPLVLTDHTSPPSLTFQHTSYGSDISPLPSSCLLTLTSIPSFFLSPLLLLLFSLLAPALPSAR